MGAHEALMKLLIACAPLAEKNQEDCGAVHDQGRGFWTSGAFVPAGLSLWVPLPPPICMSMFRLMPFLQIRTTAKLSIISYYSLPWIDQGQEQQRALDLQRRAIEKVTPWF